MKKVEQAVLEAIVRLVHELGRPVTAEEAVSAVVPPSQSHLRFKASYKYCAERLARRGLLNATTTDLAQPWRYSPTVTGMAQLEREQPSD